MDPAPDFYVPMAMCFFYGVFGAILWKFLASFPPPLEGTLPLPRDFDVLDDRP